MIALFLSSFRFHFEKLIFPISFIVQNLLWITLNFRSEVRIVWAASTLSKKSIQSVIPYLRL